MSTDKDTSGSERCDPGKCAKRIADHLREAGLDTERFIEVHDGEKKSTDHTQFGPERVNGN